MDVLIQNKYAFIFVLIRISVILTFGIFFGDKRLNNMVKFAFIFLITMIVTPTIETGVYSSTLSDFEFTTIIISEVLIGLIIAFMSILITNIMQTAGAIIDIQGGFGMSQVFDPTTQTQTSIVSQFLIAVGMLFFVMNDFHITFIKIIIESFDYIPIGVLINLSDFGNLIQTVIKTTITSISIGVCIALPVIGVIFMVDVILGIATRTMPQLNLFSVGYIVKIFTTMILIYIYTLSVNYFINMITNYIFKCIERLV